MIKIQFDRRLAKYNYAEELAMLDRQPQTHAIIKMREDLLYDIHMRAYPGDFIYREEFSREKVLREIYSGNLYSQKAYNPEQPRLPRGQPGAGEWVGDNSGRVRVADNSGTGAFLHLARDFRVPRLPPVTNPHYVPIPQRNPAQNPPPNPGNTPRSPIGDGAAAAIMLYNRLWGNPEPGLRPAIEFNSTEYNRVGEHPDFGIARVRELTRENTQAYCPRLAEVQSRLDRIDQEVRDQFPYLNPQNHGTEVHYRLAAEINDQKNPNFIAEKSFLKTSEVEAIYGQKGTVRIDAYERVDTPTVCIYDIKTGRARLGISRMGELATTSLKNFGPSATRIIVTEVRPVR